MSEQTIINYSNNIEYILNLSTIRLYNLFKKVRKYYYRYYFYNEFKDNRLEKILFEKIKKELDAREHIQR